MTAQDKIVLAFDAYGTLLSTESIAEHLAKHLGKEKAGSVAQIWRKHQLEYTWRLNSMGKQQRSSGAAEQETELTPRGLGTYVDFEEVTRGALQNALAETQTSLNDGQIDDVMQAYNSLTIFPDVATTIESLRDEQRVHPVIFSNGTLSMVSASIQSSSELNKHADVLKDIVVVEPIKKYKPAPEVYRHLAARVGKNAQSASSMAEIWLVTGNPFDVVGARHVGINAAWIDRAGNGWPDSLIKGDKGRPSTILQSLDQIVARVLDYHSEHVKAA